MGAGKFLHPPEIVGGDPLFAVGTLEKTKLIHHGKQEKRQGDAPEPQQPGLILGPEEHIKKDRADAGGKGPFFHPQHKPSKLKPGKVHGFPSFLEDFTLFYSIKQSKTREHRKIRRIDKKREHNAPAFAMKFC